MNLKNIRVITATNETDTYFWFWPTVAKSWINHIGAGTITLAFISNRQDDDPMVQSMRRYGEVVLLPPIPGIPSGNQAKVARMYLASRYPGETCLLADIDMYLLNPAKLLQWLGGFEPDKLLAIGRNAYYNSAEEGKFPMYYTTGTSQLYAELVNPRNLGFSTLCQSWKGLGRFDAKEDISHPPDQFSDESLMRSLISTWEPRRVVHIEREDFVGMQATLRIDRSRWDIDKAKLKCGEYIDCNPLRPLPRYLNKVRPVLEYMNIPEKDHLLRMETVI